MTERQKKMIRGDVEKRRPGGKGTERLRDKLNS
jgi:hypothetical protein